MDKVTVIGMDLGDKNHKAVVLAADGTEVERAEVKNTPEQVQEFLARHPGALLAVETGTHCRWISRLAAGLGHEVLVGNTRKLRMIWNSSRKNDWNDAEMLAKLARADRSLLVPVKLRDDESQELLRLVKARDILVKHRAGIVNMIRGFCKAQGVRMDGCTTEAFVRQEFDVPKVLREVTQPLFAVLRELSKKVALFDKILVRSLEKKHPEEAAAVMAINGVGPVTAAAFIATVGNPTTFGKPRDAGAYFGLVPRQDQSGQSDRQLRITKEGNTQVRALLVNCANYIMGPFGKDCDLRRHGLRIAARGGKNARKRAKVAVARKLAVVMLALLQSKKEYCPLMGDAYMA